MLRTRIVKIIPGHTNAITAFAVSSDGKRAATGQKGRDAVIIVWWYTYDEVSGYTARSSKSGRSNAFSRDGKTIASAGADDGHTAFVHTWQTQRKQKICTGSNLLLHLCLVRTILRSWLLERSVCTLCSSAKRENFNHVIHFYMHFVHQHSNTNARTQVLFESKGRSSSRWRKRRGNCFGFESER